MLVMRRVVSVLCGISLCGGPVTAAPRQPAAPWHVDYDEAQCVAMRDYGTKQKQLILALKPSPNGTVMRVLVIQKGSAGVEQTPTRLWLGATQKKTRLLRYPDEKQHLRIVSINVPMSEFKANIAMTSISILGGPLNETFAVTDLQDVVTELDKCLVDLQDYWNVGPQYKERFASSVMPTVPLAGLFKAEDYPGIALDSNQQGSVAMTFLVDEKGGVADCSIDDTSGIPALDTMSCYVIKSRAHFQPALGRDGKPVRSGYTGHIVWKIASVRKTAS